MIVTLPDGYNGSTARFFAEPIERDGALVKLRCAEPGMTGCIRWVRASEILSAPTSPQGPLELTPAEVGIHDPAPEREGEIAGRESLDPEGAGQCHRQRTASPADAHNGLTARRDGQLSGGRLHDINERP